MSFLGSARCNHVFLWFLGRVVYSPHRGFTGKLGIFLVAGFCSRCGRRFLKGRLHHSFCYLPLRELLFFFQSVFLCHVFSKGYFVPTVFSAIFTVAHWPLEMFCYDVSSDAKRQHKCDLTFPAHPFIAGGAYQEIPDHSLFDILNIFAKQRLLNRIIYTVTIAACLAGLCVGWSA